MRENEARVMDLSYPVHKCADPSGGGEPDTGDGDGDRRPEPSAERRRRERGRGEFAVRRSPPNRPRLRESE